MIEELATIELIKEPGFPENLVQNSALAKFGTKAEPDIRLWMYAQRHSFSVKGRGRKDESSH